MTKKKSNVQQTSQRKRADAEPQRGKTAPTRSRKSETRAGKSRFKRDLQLELEQRNAELAVINSVQQGLAAQLDMQAIYDLVGDKIREIFDAQGMLIASFDHATRLGHFHYLIERGQRFYPEPMPFNKMHQYLIRTGQVLLVNQNSEQRAAELGMEVIPGTEMPKSLVYVPLIVGDKVKGVISLQNMDRENAFSESDVRLLTTLANSMSVALENARLFNETQRLLKETEQRAAELAIINSIQQGLASKLDFQAIVDLVGDKLRQVFSMPDLGISWHDEKTNLLHPLYVYEHGERLSTPPGQPRPNGPFARMTKTRQPIIWNTAEEGDAISPVIPGTDASKSGVFIPLISNDRVLGNITLENYERENAYGESELRLLTTIAASLGAALENARLFNETLRLLKETEQRNSELQIINRVGQGLAKQLDFQSIIDLVGDEIAKVFPSVGAPKLHSIFIALYDPQTDLIQFPYWMTGAGNRVKVEPQPLGRGLTSKVIQSRQPLALGTWQQAIENGSVIVDDGNLDFPQSWLGVPIIVGDQVTGVISVQDEPPNLYGESHVRLLSTLAANLGTAIENARLFHETQRLLKETEQRVAELAIINSIQQGLAAELDFQAIVDLVGDKLRHVFATPDLGINWYDQKANLIHALHNYEHGERLTIPSQPPRPDGPFVRMTKTRQPVVWNTVEEGDAISPVIPGTDASKSGVFIPIISSDRVLGTIQLENYERENAYGESELRLLTTIAASLGAALENAYLFNKTQRLLEETEQRNSELQIINRVGQGLAKQLDFQSIIDLVGDEIAKVFPPVGAPELHSIFIALYDASTNLIRIPYWMSGIGNRVRIEPLPLGLGLTSKVIQTRQPLVLGTWEQAAENGAVTVDDGIKDKSQSWLGVPILVSDQVTGVISVQDAQPNLYGESHVRLLSTLAANLGTAIENARLFHETKRLLTETQQRTAELQIINSVQQALSTQLEVQAIYDLFGDKIRDIFDAQAILIYMFDHAKRFSRACYSIEKGQRFYPTPRPFSKMVEHLIRTRELVLINEDAERRKAEFGLQIVPGTESAKSLVYVPLIVGEQVIGCVTLQNIDHENAFSESDVRLLTTLANSMSVALENTRLFEETKRLLAETEHRAAELAVINSVQQGLAAQLDMQAIYNLVGDKIREVFDAQAVMIQTYDHAARLMHTLYGIEKGERFYPEPFPFTGLPEHLIRARQLVLINEDVIQRSAEFGMYLVPGTEISKSMLFVPLILGEQVKGVISLQNIDRENAFSESDVRLLTTLASSMSVALENARLFAEERQRAAELATVNRVSQALASQVGLDALIRLAGDQIRETFNADVAYIALLDRVTNTINFPYCFGENFTTILFGEGLTSKIIESGQPLLINRDVGEKSMEIGATLIGTEAKSYLGVPIFVGKEAIGVMSVQSLQHEGRFNDNDTRLLATIAANVGVAIERARLFEQTQEAQRRLSDIIDFLPDATLVIDREGHVIAWNRAIEEMTGIKAQDMIRKGNYEYAMPFYGERRPILIDLVLLPQEEIEKQYAQVHREGTVLIGETYVSSLKGGGRYLLGTASALRDAKGHIIGAIETIRDITDRKHATEELEQAKIAADSANAAKSAFLATMSHEIRTPMNAIIGMSGLMMDTPLNKEQREYAEIIRNSGDALLTIINDILDFSKIEAGKMELESQPFELRACVESALDLVAPRAAEKGLDLAYVMDDEVPAAIVGDVTRLRQIMINLLTNAVKFTEKGEVVLTVGSTPVAVPTGRPPGLPLHELHFSVRDTGIGIPADRMDRLFQSFSQIDPTTARRYGGTGLGLAISKRLCEMMGGRIWVESPSISSASTGGTQGGPGSTFHYTIAAQPAPDFETRKRVVGAQPQLSGKRLLIVDDNDTNRLIVIRQTRVWGMLTRDTASPKEALEWITRGDPFDVAIVDMSMPGMDGLTLCAEIRKIETLRASRTSLRLPIVICSSLGRREAITDALGIATILTKPLKQSQLFDALAGIFAGPTPEQKPASPVTRQLDAEMARRLPLRILLAEDNATNQKLALRLLQQMGYRADVAGNGLETLQALARQPYDVVLMDVQMPEMDGLEATRQICQRWTRHERPRIIAMTANALQGDREMCLVAGMDDYIAKPIRVNELVGALSKCPVRRQKEEPMTETNLIDPTVFDGLLASTGGDMAFLAELMDTYFNDAPQLLAAMRGALADGKVEEFRRAAHSLKSNSASLGAMTLSALAKELEMMGRAGVLDGAEDKIARVEAEYAQVKDALEQKRGK